MNIKEALEKANEQAQELINKYDLVMGKDYTIDEDGAIKIKTGEGTSLDNKQTITKLFKQQQVYKMVH